uniref:Uncharacterized protein n=1 Tax=Romanomermis culicivorax TaxID=13658 RepID=A0A915L2Q4_ROMCU
MNLRHLEQKTTRSNHVMPNQRSNAQHPSSTTSDKIWQLQSEMVRLMAHIARITAQQQSSASRNLTPPTQPLVHIQNAGDHPLGAHLQICSFHGRCTHNNASWEAQHPNSAGPSNTTANSSFVTKAMWAIWSVDLAKKYPHLPWALLNEPFEVDALTAADVVLLTPMAL